MPYIGNKATIPFNSSVTSAKLVYPLTTFSSTGIDDNADAVAMTIDSTETVIFTNGATFGSHVLPSTDDAYDLGSSTKQWRDIYTGDINLNNTKTRDNEIDGTRGSWTIQEGSNDLFLINRLTNKKYKFKLQEIV